MSEARERARSALTVLHNRIDECVACESQVPGFKKIRGLRRGDCGRIVIVGQGPGRTEKARLKAFSGQSGRRLEAWLVECGADALDPRRDIYFTSVTKCEAGGSGPNDVMVRNCRPFLLEQLQVINPGLVITLGQIAYDTLRLTELSYSAALCIPVDSRDVRLFSPIGFDYRLLPWPHPSGLNRWLNNPQNMQKLRASFPHVRPFLGENS